MIEEKILDKAIDIFGTTDLCLMSSFILPDGKILDIRHSDDGYHQEHSTVAEAYRTDEGFRDKDGIYNEYDMPMYFNRDAPAISFYNNPFGESYGIELNVSSELTDRQFEKLEECVCYIKPNKKKRIAIEFYDKRLRPETRQGYEESTTPKECFKAINKIKRAYKNERARAIEKERQDR